MMNFFNYYSAAFEGAISHVFGEPIEYHFSNGEVRQLTAVVERERMAQDSNGIPVRVFAVTVPANKSTGLVLSEIDIDDIIYLPKVVGETPEGVAILETEDDGSGVITLYCR